MNDIVNQLGLDDVKVDVNGLYREEVISDRKVAQLRQMIPITKHGEVDTTRARVFLGSTSIMMPTGPLPINCEIPASSLEEACEQFPAAIKEAVEKMVARAQEMQREESKRIVTPNELKGNNGGIII